MKNVMIANLQEGAKSGNDKHKQAESGKLIAYMLAQIDNALSIGWKPSQIIIASNIDFEHKGVSTIKMEMNETCLTGSKTMSMFELFDTGIIDELAWVHDLDAWQISKFKVGDMKDVGISTYSKPKLNGGSVFYRPSAKDIVKELRDIIIERNEDKEEPVLNELLNPKNNAKYADRVTLLDTSYNLGCSGFKKRYQNAEKPIKVCHFHPTNRTAWDTFVRDRELLGYSPVDNRLYSILKERFYPFIKDYNYDKDRGHKGGWERPNFEQTTNPKISDNIEKVIIKPKPKKDKKQEKIDKSSGIWPVKEAKKHKHDYLLAGAIAHTYSPELAFDLGCGDGTYVSILRSCGWKIKGFEGTGDIEEVSKIDDITQIDLSEPQEWKEKADFVMCLEVGEHIPREKEDAFLRNIASVCSKHMVLSWATPGQGGRGHVNEQPVKYIACKMKAYGLEVNEKITDFLRNHSTFKYFKNNILALDR